MLNSPLSRHTKLVEIPKHIIQRRANLAAMARAHLEALRGEHPVEDDESADAAVMPFAQAAKAQGPPN